MAVIEVASLVKRYGEHGERKDLNFIQRKFAYGLSALIEKQEAAA